MATKREFKELAKLRLEEAEHLYRKKFYDGCVYLCGYVIESALKARICRVLNLTDYPDKGEVGRIFRTHDFDVLKILAGLQKEISISKNKPLFDNWSIATAWKPEQRYSPAGTCDRKKAQDVLSSIKQTPNGVLTWLARRW